MLTVYTKPGCPHCVEAKRYLDHHKIGFQEVDIMQDADALSFLREQGHRTVPQFYVGHKLLEGGNLGLQRLTPDYIRQMSS